jgi:anti-anti-sigma regulatory factor
MDPDSADSDAILRIEGDMSIYRANELKAVLLQALQASPQTEVDLSAVTEMDTMTCNC